MLQQLTRWTVAAFVMVLLAFPAGEARAQAYELKPGDIVEVSVLEDPSLNRRVLVGPDGAISLPLAGALQAGGKTLRTVQNGIAARLRGQFVNPPTVTVSLVALGPDENLGLGEADALEPEDAPEIASFYVLGEVGRPGRYDFETGKHMTVLQALAIAGGPGVFAARSRIQLRSRIPDPDAPAPPEPVAAESESAATEDSDEVEKAPPAPPMPTIEDLRIFDYTALEDGDPDSELLFVRDGDVIIVPERGLFE